MNDKYLKAVSTYLVVAAIIFLVGYGPTEVLVALIAVEFCFILSGKFGVPLNDKAVPWQYKAVQFIGPMVYMAAVLIGEPLATYLVGAVLCTYTVCFCVFLVAKKYAPAIYHTLNQR